MSEVSLRQRIQLFVVRILAMVIGIGVASIFAFQTLLAGWRKPDRFRQYVKQLTGTASYGACSYMPCLSRPSRR